MTSADPVPSRGTTSRHVCRIRGKHLPAKDPSEHEIYQFKVWISKVFMPWRGADQVATPKPVALLRNGTGAVNK
jgi:hypothetical protein